VAAVGLHAATVRADHLADQRQTQPEAPAAGAAGATGEAVEQPLRHRLVEAGAVVAHLQQRLAPAAGHRHPHLAAGAPGVLDSVVEQAEDDSPQRGRRAIDPHRLQVGHDPRPDACRVACDSHHRLPGQRRQLDRDPLRPALAQLGAEQKVLDDLAHAASVALQRRDLLAHDLQVAGIEVAAHHLRAGVHQRQRRAQLVGGVGHEAALALDGLAQRRDRPPCQQQPHRAGRQHADQTGREPHSEDPAALRVTAAEVQNRLRPSVPVSHGEAAVTDPLQGVVAPDRLGRRGTQVARREQPGGRPRGDRDDAPGAVDQEQADPWRRVRHVVAGGGADRLLQQPMLRDALVVQQQEPGDTADDHQHAGQRKRGLERQGDPRSAHRPTGGAHAEPIW
jgi:hypothetical protein